MKIHHLSCGTMCPPLARALLNPEGHMVCHCLLLEVGGELVLVDTGLGLDDLADPRGRLGRPFATFVNPVRDPELTAARQVERLGFSRSDVRHLVVTHLDLDHAGGLPDFPEARVHVIERERAAALDPRTFHERMRYCRHHWAHGPEWAAREPDPAGEDWFGFECVRDLDGLPPEILMVPLVGHTRGHAGVAVKGEDGWLLHCGDAYFYRDEVNPGAPRCTPGLAAFQRFVQMDGTARVRNQLRLRELARHHGGEVTLFSAHDPAELGRLQRDG